LSYGCLNAKPKTEFLIRRGFRTANQLKAKRFVSFEQDTQVLSAEELTCPESLKGLTGRLGGAFIHL